MNSSEFKKSILSLTQDIIFSYKNKEYGINPFNINKFEIGTENDVVTFSDIDELFAAEIFDGQCLNDISDLIELY